MQAGVGLLILDVMPIHRHDYLKFYQLPNSNLFTHRMLFFSREATSEIYGPGSLLYYICLCKLFLFAFIFISIFPKLKNTLMQFIVIYFISRSREIYLSNLSYFYPVYLPISGVVAWKGLTTPLIRRVASICYLCAGVVHVVLRGSLTGSITLVSSLREIHTVGVMHHPFLFGEIPT